jgi:ABC-type ATPase with predicted acetyltransferase domain
MYNCPDCGYAMPSSSALHYQVRCPRCGAVWQVTVSIRRAFDSMPAPDFDSVPLVLREDGGQDDGRVVVRWFGNENEPD